jgi:hypothetical protein
VYEAQGFVVPPLPPVLVDASILVGASVMSPELQAASAAVREAHAMSLVIVIFCS